MFDNRRHQAPFGSGDLGNGDLGNRTAEPIQIDSFAVQAGPRHSVEHLELIGSQLRAEGAVDLGRFGRLSDYVNFLGGFFNIHDVTLLARTGAPTRITFPELRVRLSDIALVAQREPSPPNRSGPDPVIPKRPGRLVVMTDAHIIYGSVWLHEQGSMTGFIESSDPAFIPMTGVRVRWLADRRLAGRYAFALLQRSHIVGVSLDAEDRPRTIQAPRPLSLAVPGPGSGLLGQRRLAVGG